MQLHPDRVHVVPLQYEHDRVIEPLRSHGADVVYLLYDETLPERPTYWDELGAEITDGIVSDADCHWIGADHGDPYDVFGLVTTLSQHHLEDSTGVNVATGSKLAAIGAAFGCMDTDTEAQAYYPHAASRAVDGTEEPVTSGYDGETELVEYPIWSPSREQVAMLAVVTVESDSVADPKKRTLIDRGLELAVRHDETLPFVEGAVAAAADDRADGEPIEFCTHLSRSEQVSAYARLSSHVTDPLEDRGYLETRESGRQVILEPTETGRKTLQAFRHEIESLLDPLSEIYRRSGIPDAEVPDWLEPDLPEY